MSLKKSSLQMMKSVALNVCSWWECSSDELWAMNWDDQEDESGAIKKMNVNAALGTKLKRKKFFG